MAQGRAIRRVVTLFDSLEDLVAENDRRYEFEEDAETTAEYQDFSWVCEHYSWYDCTVMIGCR